MIHYYPLLSSYIDNEWDLALSSLFDFIRIPNQSPNFSSTVYTDGLQESALFVLKQYVELQMEVLNCHVQMILHENKTPLLYVEIPACNVENDKTVLFYGHGDKQPPMKESWREELGPYDPVIKEGRLYGRGSSDDGYALYAAMIAVKSLRKFNKEHARCCVFIEFGEESGSPDLRV